MKEAVTKFDFESAFKALDDIEIPAAGKVRANRPALTEIFSKKSKFDYLMEEYYDVSSPAELEDAQEAREAEVAKAKLERIEKIVDLDAESPEDLLTSYVGKNIMQCPQCMTLFYKDPEDIVKSEEDPSIVNVNEICQHCGNEDGYTLVGKVGEAEPGEFEEEPALYDLNIPEEATEEEPAEEASEESEDLGDLEALDLNLEDEEEEKKEESFTAHEGESLVEELADDPELDEKLEANDEYIEYLRNAIADEEAKLEKASNEQIKVILQRNIDSLNADLEAALPAAVIDGTAISSESAPEEPIGEEEVAPEVEVEPEVEAEVEVEPEQQEESCEAPVEGDTLTESLHEDADVEVSAEEFEELINSPEFNRPISDAAVRDMLNAEKEEEESVDESLNEGVFDNLKGKLMTRKAKADWILKNALIDYDNENTEENQKFTTFIVIGYKDKFTNGRAITTAPAYNNTNLVVGLKRPEAKANYADAEKIAKGWSIKDGSGPAFIYLAKNTKGEGAAFLCQYFKGEIDAKSDQLEKYFKSVASSIKGSKLMAKGGADQSDYEKVTADKVEKGSKIKLNDQTCEITDINTSELDNSSIQVGIKYEDGSIKTHSVNANYTFFVLRDNVATESLDAVMSGLEDLQEATLEALISDSLVEAYGNVAGFRLAECAYNDSKFTVDGTIYFTSGNTRKTTYVFNESCEAADGKVSLRGLNEKLGADKQFVITVRIDNKTLITESFKCNK